VSGELLTVKLRWKEPQGEESRKLEVPFTDDGRFVDDAAQDFRFAAAVAEFAMILRGSPHRGDASFESIVALAEADRNFDPTGDRADFVRLVRIAQGLAGG
jgi:Ca-activated chloride channel family protein